MVKTVSFERYEARHWERPILTEAVRKDGWNHFVIWKNETKEHFTVKIAGDYKSSVIAENVESFGAATEVAKRYEEDLERDILYWKRFKSFWGWIGLLAAFFLGYCMGRS